MTTTFLTIASFAFFSVLNVVLQTIRSIFTIKASNQMAAIASAVCFSVYTIVLQQLGEVSLILSVAITGAANYIGTLVAMWLLNRFKKDTMWVIDVLIDDPVGLAVNLFAENIDYTCTATNESKNAFRIYSCSQQESIKIKKILQKYKLTYGVTQTSGRL